jgi:Flp pilus assembly protein TadB
MSGLVFLLLVLFLTTSLWAFFRSRAKGNQIISLLENEGDLKDVPVSATKIASASTLSTLEQIAILSLTALLTYLIYRLKGGVTEQVFIVPLAFFGVSVLFCSRKNKLKHLKEDERLEFYLPLVIERLVMAVQAGLDILPAMQSIYELGLKEGDNELEKVDPATKIFGKVLRLHNSGVSLLDALGSIGKECTSVAAKHALSHLSLAFREGGSLIEPLRELSDATQTIYQERIEERIAKLPVKAVLPLLCTFAGLIICFLVTPILEVITYASKLKP